MISRTRGPPVSPLLAGSARRLSRRGFLYRAAVSLTLGGLVLPARTARASLVGQAIPLWAQLSLPDDRQPIVAEVIADGVPVYAYPSTGSEVRRPAKAGDLLRVVGQAPGIDGDDHTWWATPEGFVAQEALQPASGQFVDSWTLPGGDAAAGGWWGQLNSEAHVRTAPTTDAPIVGVLGPGQHLKVVGEEQGTAFDGDPT